eukprot:jgi/Phyca11/21924/fgenesh1_pg.PHYCAscaffold_222_\
MLAEAVMLAEEVGDMEFQEVMGAHSGSGTYKKKKKCNRFTNWFKRLFNKDIKKCPKKGEEEDDRFVVVVTVVMIVAVVMVVTVVVIVIVTVVVVPHSRTAGS